jgi:hypothetical protein
MYFYFYKITNLINEKFYYGVHSTNNLNDGYMGSGKYLKRAKDKYGVENFKKEILKYFNSKEEMFEYEKQIVTEALVNDRNCYNIMVGGKGGFNFSKEDMDKMKEKSRMTKIKNDSYKKLGEKLSYYYKVLRPDEAKRISDIRTQKRLELWKEKPELKEKTYKKISKTLCDFWENIDEIDPEYRNKRGELVKNSEKFKAGCKRMGENNRGYNNPDFKARWKNIYEKDMVVISELMMYSNLPDDFIIEMFDKKVKSPNLIKYYQHIGLLPNKISEERKSRFLNFNGGIKGSHKDGFSLKTIFTNEVKYNISLFFDDFFEDLQKIIETNKNYEISNSMISQNDKYFIKNYISKIKYFKEIGVLKNETDIKIKVDVNVNGKTHKKTAKKTIFDVDFSNIKCILIDKEFNTYGIDENGRPFQKGKFELCINGEKYTL